MNYAIGIDLGTTNTELAYVRLDDYTKPQTLNIPQFVAPSVVELREQLPSFLYIGADAEDKNEWKLPWEKTDESNDPESSNKNEEVDRNLQSKRGNKGFFRRVFGLSGSDADENRLNNQRLTDNRLFLTGEIACLRATSESERVVSSAKSWLTAQRVDRRSPILPWNSPNDVFRVSPVEASRRYLAHLVAAWNNAFPDDPIFEQQVVLTVPASFDESARDLTREAARGAGLNLETLVLLEEPQAALYAWLAGKGDDWRSELKAGDIILICDVGGGTTDLSLIRVEDNDGTLELSRLAVGKRLLLGGDNLDLALAFRASELFAEQGLQLNPWQSHVLQRQCRIAKEYLLSEQKSGNETFKIVVEGRSSRIVEESISVDLSKKDAETIILDGFFPICGIDERPNLRSKMAVREVGLPFESDSAVSKHIAHFLTSRSTEDGLGRLVPNYFLLNGGVFKAPSLKRRFNELITNWFPEDSPRDLCSDSNLDQAVAIGAAYYGYIKKRGGIRIRAASPRSYYIGVESSGPSIPGVPRPIKVLCIVPYGMEEGTALLVPSSEFELVTGESALFRFFSSTTRPDDKVGDLVDWRESDNGGIEETTPIETILDDYNNSTSIEKEGDPKVQFATIHFRVVITELGTLEIWCEETNGDRRWKLEFSTRGE